MPNLYTNPQLKNRYQQNASFRQIMDQNQKNYLQRKQESIYCDLSKVNDKIMQISSQSIDETNHNGSKIYSQKKHILYVYSHFQPQNPQELNKFFLHFIHIFPEPNEAFNLIYVNSAQSAKSKCWSTFKTVILEQLPLKYLLYMQKIVLIRPSLLDKASSIVQFGVQNKFINSKLEKYQSLKLYFESVNKKIDQMKNFLPIEVIQEELGIESTVKNVPFFICNFNQNRASCQSTGLEEQLLEDKKNKITTISQFKPKQKEKGLEHYPTGESGIPLALQLLIFYFTQVPIRCQTQGIFRKCTFIDDQMLLIKELEKQNYEILAAVENQIAVASTMKRFLSKLEPPIIPYDNYERLTANHSLNSMISEIHSFPIVNFMALMHVLKFLRKYIIPHEKRNLMTLENVSICFAPCLMRSKQVTMKQFILATINVEITKLMLLNFEQIFGDNQKVKRISNKAYKLYRKNWKLNENTAACKLNQKQEGQQQIEINVIPPRSECLQGFLQPANTIFEDQRESQNQRYSEISDYSNDKRKNQAKQQQGSQVYQQKKFTGITLTSTKIPHSNSQILFKEAENQQDSMKKHKSQKRLPLMREGEEEKRKSETDKIDIEGKRGQNASNSQEIQRINKLRVNRSRMSNI